jgi:capsular exopolysaccharide synthesis family protein
VPSARAWGDKRTVGESLRRYRLRVIAVTLLAALGAYFISSSWAPMYEASTRLFLTDPRNQVAFRDIVPRSVDPARYVPQQAERITSAPVLARASELLAEDVLPSELRRRLDVRANSALDLLVITARDRSAEGATNLANIVGRAYQQVARETTLAEAEAAITELDEARSGLGAEMAAAEEALSADADDRAAAVRLQALGDQALDLEARAQQIAVEAAVRGSGVDLVEAAEVPASPRSPRPIRDAVLVALLAAVCSMLIALWRGTNQQAAQDPGDAMGALGVPLLGEVPHFGTLRSGRKGPALALPPQAKEALDFLLASIDFSMGGRRTYTLLVTSAMPGDGKSSMALQLALAAAGDGRRVLLVDGDIRGRGLTQRLEHQPRKGLTELVRGEATADEVIEQYPGTRGELTFLPAGAMVPDPPGFFRTAGLRDTMGLLATRAELVFMDSPPILAVVDASIASIHADAILLVVNRGAPLVRLREVQRRLSFTPTPVIGYAFNRGRSAGHGYGYYGAPQAEDHRRAGRPPSEIAQTKRMAQ